jgi:DNA-binding NtrC family response regulator
MKPVIVTISRNGFPFEAYADRLKEMRVTWVPTTPGASAITTIERRQPSLIIVKTEKMEERDVLSGIDELKSRFPAIAVFLVTRHSSEEMAIGALKNGVSDYFKQPLEVNEFVAAIEKRLSASPEELNIVKNRISSVLIGNCQVMNDLKKQLSRIARSDSTVLITGETGTGKDLAASLLHRNSSRASKPMISVNCAAIPDSLVESELFGYERGAFTGAVAPTPGRFRKAHKGTVFLDEIGDMSPLAQAKILRVIEEKKIAPLGSTKAVPLDFRLIAASNREPEDLIQEGAFRSDLFYRLNVARLHMPSLRNHYEDIPFLVDHCIRRLNRKFNRNIRGLKKGVLELLYGYEWPGNVRELINVLEGAYVNMPIKRIEYADLPTYFKNKLLVHRDSSSNERKRILSALLETNWNKSNAAVKLKWSRMTLYRKMAKYKIVEKRNSSEAGY